MNLFKIILLSLFVLGITRIVSAQNLDPETQKLLDQYKDQSMPAEVATLMPSDLKISSKRWMVEASTKMLLEANLGTDSEEVNIGGKVIPRIEYKIHANVFNVKIPAGKMTADASLKNLRNQAQSDWSSSHQAGKDGFGTKSAPEKIAVPKGYILIQKTFTPKHNEGAGSAPETTTYCGFLYLEIDNGLLTAETGEVTDRGVLLDKILRYTSTVGTKIKWDKYFK